MFKGGYDDSVVGLLGENGELYLIADDITKVDCEPLKNIWDTDVPGVFYGLTRYGNYVLIKDGKLESMEDQLKTLDNFTVQDNIIWSWSDGVLKVLQYDGKFNLSECKCDEPLKVYGHNRSYLAVTDTQWVFSSGYRMDKLCDNIACYTKICIFNNFISQRVISSDGKAWHIQCGNAMKYQTDCAINCVGYGKIGCANGKIITIDDGVVFDAKVPISIVKGINSRKYLFASANHLYLNDKLQIEYHADIYKLFAYSNRLIVILKDLSVHFSEISESAVSPREDLRFDYPLMGLSKQIPKNARKLSDFA